MRKLATIQKIKDIAPIEGADKIEMLTINGWHVVDKKGFHTLGDLVCYFEIDSMLPRTSVTEFLFANAKKGATEIRLKTSKFRGQISQGLVISLANMQKMAEELGETIDIDTLDVGKDMSDILHVEKYIPPVEMSMVGAITPWPLTLPKTDEERIQNIPEILENLIASKTPVYGSVKLDGTSITAAWLADGFHLYSHANEYINTDPNFENNTFYKQIKKQNIPSVLEEYAKEHNCLVALQGEMIGQKIQKNRMNIDNHYWYVFNLSVSYDRGMSWERLGYDNLVEFSDTYNVKIVPYVITDWVIPEGTTVDDLLKLSEGTYKKDSLGYFPKAKEGQQREGIVFRTKDFKTSFKVLNNKYLLKIGG